MKKLLISILLLTGGAYVAVKSYLHFEVKRAADQMVADAAPLLNISYSGVTTSLSGSAGITGVSIDIPQTGETLDIESVQLHTPSLPFLLGMKNRAKNNEFPEQLGLGFYGVDVDLASDYAVLLEQMAAANSPASTQPICTKRELSVADYRALGIDRLKLDLTARYHYQPENTLINFAMDMAAREVFEMTVSGDFEMNEAPTDPMALQRFKFILLRGTIDMHDHALAKAMTQNCERDHGMTRAEAIEAQVQSALASLSDMRVEPDQGMIDTYREFIDTGKALHISLRPDEPLDLSHIKHYKPADVPALLGLEMALR